MRRIGFPRRGVVVAMTVVAWLGVASAASAATFTVNDPRDFPQSPTAPAGTCQSTAGASSCTLRAAVQAANQNGGSSTIDVPSGSFTLSNTSSTGYTVCSGGEDESVGDLKVNDCNNSTSITVIGAGSGSTVISGENKYRLFTLYPNGILDLQKMTLENGVGSDGTAYGSNFQTSGGDFSADDGGAVISEGHLSAESVTFTGNTVPSTAGHCGGCGGGLDAENVAGSTASLTDDVFQNNSAPFGGAIDVDAPSDATIAFTLFQSNTSTNDGGAIEADGDAAGLTLNFDDFVQNVTPHEGGGVAWYGNGALNVTNSLFTQNQTTTVQSQDGGGGLYSDGFKSSNVNVSNTSFDGNSTVSSAGALADVNSNGLSLTQDRFANNSARMVGGAVYLDSTNSHGTTIRSSEFDGNSATNSGVGGGGGAISWGNGDNPGSLTLDGDSFVLNSAAFGGALDDEQAAAAALVMVDSTMSRNTASRFGGAIFLDGASYGPTPVTLTNDTIAFNNAPAQDGGGMSGPFYFESDGSSSFGIENTTIAENSGGDCDQKGIPKQVDMGNNNDSDQSCFGGVGGPNDLVGVNPLLSNPASNGGPAAGGPGDTETVQTDAESANSPTVDAGNSNGCPTVDERGVSRPQGKACDIGAFEFGASPLTTTTTTATAVPAAVTSTTTTPAPKPKPKPKPKAKKCGGGKHRSHGRCVKNKKKHHKKHPRHGKHKK